MFMMFMMFIIFTMFSVFMMGGGGSNSIFVCRFCEHFAKKRGWTDINVHKSAHKILRIIAIIHDLSASTDQERGYPGIQKHSLS